jgi:Protein of unknown function (DUF732)
MRAKFLISAVVAGAALATGLAAPANAEGETDAIFISVLDEEGIPYTSASDAIAVANGVCTYLSEGNTLEDATLEVMNESGLGVEQSGFFVGAATAAYCPDQSP